MQQERGRQGRQEGGVAGGRRTNHPLPGAPGALALLAILSLGCGTLATPAGGDVDLPNAAAGPFRLLKKNELADPHIGPYVLDDKRRAWHDPWALDADGDPATLAIELYAVAGKGTLEIARFTAADGRSTNLVGEPVLAPDQAWEGGAIAAPTVLRAGDDRWLWYAAAGGIGLARSVAGGPFAKEPAPVFDATGATWDAGATPSDPAVWRLPDGTLRMAYVAGGVIGEATSADGVRWTRLGAVLAPTAAPAAPPVDGGLDEPFDDVALSGPCVVRGETAEGRAVTWLYYVGENRLGATAVGLAARYGDTGAFTRAVGPVLATPLGPASPSVVRFASFTLLYAGMRAGSSASADYPAVAGGVAPATASLAVP